MKFSRTNSTVLSSKYRYVAVLRSACLIGLTVVAVFAQQNAKRVTGLQVSDGSEGARVTINSDAAMNDYEAFRRGDRFYVRIPLAEFVSGKPGFHGDGFEDVQVQKVGDSVVVSFKLQPGASARVDQRANQLIVIFTAPNRMQRAATASSRSGVGSGQGSANRQRYAAGPVPPITEYRELPAVVRKTKPRQNAASSTTTGSESSKGTSYETRLNPGQTSASSSSSPSYPSSSSSPTPLSYPAWTSGTNAPSTGASPGFTSSSPSATNKPAGASTRFQSLRQWVAANRKVSLGLGLGLLAALVILGLAMYRRRNPRSKTKRVPKANLAQPKYVSKNEAGEVPAPEFGRVKPEPISEPVVEVPSRPSAPEKPSVSPAFANSHVMNEEREVIEL